MKRSSAILLLGIGLLGGCAALQKSSLTTVGTLQGKLDDDLAKLAANRGANRAADRAAVQAQLAQLAQEAQTAAQGESDPQNKVALYRIAALAAWQAGSAAADRVSLIATEGASACAALPAAQQRPTDCAIIRLAKPFAVADAFRLRLLALTLQLSQLDDAHAKQCNGLAGTRQQDCRKEAVNLPATDRQEVLQLFSGFEVELKDVRDVAHGMGNVGAGLMEAAKNGEAIIYCNAEKTWLIAKRVDGMQPDREALTCRRKRLECLLTRSDADCADSCPDDANNPVVDCRRFNMQGLALPDTHGDALR